MNQVQEKGDFGFVLLISIVATIGGFLFGFDSGVINGTVDGLTSAFNSDSVATGFNVASMLLGCAAGAALAGSLSDMFGRRTMLIVAAVFFIVSAWGSGIAGSSGEFIIYRIIGGLAVGAASVMAPAYISEIAPAHLRGRLSSIQQVAIIFGLFVAFLSNYLIAGAAGSSTSEFLLGFDAWRWMFWVELLPAAIFLVALFFIPESPRFLVARDKLAQASKVLERVSGTVAGKAKVAEIETSLANDHKPSIADAFGGVVFKPIVWVGIGLAVFQQLVGINVVFYYGAVLWQAAGFTEEQALFTNVLSGGLSIAAVILSLLIVDKVGRKPLLWIGSLGMAVTLGIVCYAFSTGELLVDGSLDLSAENGQLALYAALAYVMFFNFSWGPVMWVMLGEMFPNQMRGSGLAVAGFFQWVANFAITMTFPIMLAAKNIGLVGAYGFYAVMAAVSVVFVLWAVKETKGKELEAMTDH
ncbi:sugar porter family MFS transporter [Parvularcula sp. LCG005]|uniref:sugar porter family MFS transporter n=1 Tax=Parvularcula sp. LCG005 TaxID=3078805 RepID=UPI002941F23F|nr:sugar porter family MFS transporter [Parvularcula sp. LCG005]WOI53468.1 sugar porter family MFS transporter [Parvularcula sp. LCG005]